MKTLYLDIFSGISGDMFIGALLDLGVDFHQFEHDLEKLHLAGYHLHAKRAERSHIAGTKFDVHLTEDHHHHDEQAQDHDHGHQHSHGHEHHHEHGHGHSHAPHEEQHHHHEHGRNFSDIKKMISNSQLSPWVKEKSIAIFQRIAVAEGKIHGKPAAEVHFHEVGAVDSIVDIVGACIALEILGKPRVLAGTPVEGTGWINCAHGRFPIPAPATLEILAGRSIALSQCEEPNELITPTGAALLAELVEVFGPLQNFAPTRIGFGLGTRENKTRPNVLRAMLGETSAASTVPAQGWETDTIAVLETNLDDVTAEILGQFVEQALTAGALDVFHTPIQMKKNRPGVLLTVLCATGEADQFSELILRETSAFGVRRTSAERRKLAREFVTVRIPQGEITIKLGKLNGKVVQAAPEFESCKKLALEHNIPLKQVYAAALAVFAASQKQSNGD